MFKIKNHFGEWYTPHTSFVVRNPLFPIEVFFKWKSPNGINTESSKEILREALRKFYQQPIATEALYIGSPDLYEQLLLWLENKIEKSDKREKTELALAKYMIRMCTRCTPYGLFASCTLGKISDTTSIKLEEKESLQRFGRLDMDYVCQLYSHLLKQKEVCNQLKFYPNSSMYPLGNNLRYIEHRFTEQSGRSYHLVQVEKSPYLEKVLLVARQGATPLELATAIIDVTTSHDEAIEYIYELIFGQLLVSEMEPSVTGEEYFTVLLQKLKTLQHLNNYSTHLEEVSKVFAHLKANPKNKNNHNLYLEIIHHLKQLEIPVHLKTLVQVDSYRPASSAVIHKKVMDEILFGCTLMQLVSPSVAQQDSFADFKNAFLTRYDSQWIPLVEVLDTESGIGYGKFATNGMEESPLIDGLPIGNGSAKANSTQRAETDGFKLQLYYDAVAEGKTEIVLTDQLLEKLSKKEIKPTRLPDAMCTMVRINAKSAEDINQGNYKITLQSPSGPSGGNLLGRFCHLHPEIENFTKTILQKEEAHQKDCLFAEIVHLPESRIGNILMRPVLRNYEIPYLSGSTLDDKHQIPVTDLVVGIENGKVILRSQRLNKQVIPRMTTAHNFSMSTLPIYQFLCDLQYQQIRTVGWNWGALESSPFLPRVSYGKYILSKARWIVTKEDIKGCDEKNDNDLFLAFSKIVKKKNLPPYVLLSNGDNALLLHLENIFCVKLLLAEITKRGYITLTETLDLPGDCWIESSEGHYAGEIIVAFDKNKRIDSETRNKEFNSEVKHVIKRYFPVGSEWLYAKIYCGTKTAEKILSDVLKPLTEKLISEKYIDSYFFIRYYDHGQHIRIRFHHSNKKDFWKHVVYMLRVVLQPYVNNHAVHNLQFETYKREIERYGLDTMELSESIFYHHSVAILNFISMLDGDAGEQYRWQVALKAIDIILDDFYYNTEQKRDLIKILHNNFSSEFKIGPQEQKKISERFSSNKQLIHQLMSENLDDNKDLKTAIDAFRINSDNYRNTIEQILSSSSVCYDKSQLLRLMSSYLHMFVNRMFLSKQRMVELVIYDYLLKYYESRIAREKKKTLEVF
ncbi:lantibiotic dehydratase [Segetibacter koreensis]|uniref:lantibiotic dehydratase n=1 Tax=Segetibacter koreensis TaxID=398037 RepID=UPI000371E8CC|nr:lantibiotic dehydratase [Segetibacter koreensis]